MDCVKVKQENAVEIKVEDIFDGNNDSDDPNDPFDNSSNESVDPFHNSSNESVSNYDSDSDSDLFKEDEEYQPKNVKEQVKEIQNKVHKNFQETPTLNDQVNDETSSTSTKLSDFTILSNNKYSCNHCELVCLRSNMYRHFREKHVNVIKIKQCPYCSYTSKYNLNHHINTKHKKESEKESRILKDQVVNKSSSTKAKVQAFTILPNNKCSCNHCKLVCTQKSNMYRHIREKHRNVPRNAPKVKQCPYCSYTSKYGLTNHINATHKEGANIITNHKEESKKLSDVLKDQVVDKSSSTKVKVREFTILSNNSYSCNHCKVVCTHKSNMYRHIKRKHRIKQCPYCSYTSKYSLTNHINATHEEEKAYSTPNHINATHKEEKAYSTPGLKATDYKILANKEYGCSHCEFVAKRRKFIYKHHRRIHLKLGKYKQCPYCPYKTRYNLKVHIKYRHKKKSEVDCYECHQCGYKSKGKAYLRIHMLTHKKYEEIMDQMIKCDQCSKMYLTSRLRKHKKMVHEGYGRKTRISCHLCDYKSIHKKQMEEHIKRYHDNNENLKMLRCEKCSFETKFDFALRKHIRTYHTEIYQCAKCPYQTNTLNRLRLHTISHQKVKNESDLKYRCDKCDYKTYRIYSLQVHKLKHLKPEEIQYFYCYHCEFKAKRKDNLKTHIKNHFKKKIEFVCYICDFKTNSKVSHIAHMGKHSREQNKKQNSEANYEDKKEKRKGQSSSKNNENRPLKRRKVRENDNDMTDKLEENQTVPLKSLNVNKTSEHAMTMRDRTKRKALMPSLSQKSQKEIQS